MNQEATLISLDNECTNYKFLSTGITCSQDCIMQSLRGLCMHPLILWRIAPAVIVAAVYWHAATQWTKCWSGDDIFVDVESWWLWKSIVFKIFQDLCLHHIVVIWKHQPHPVVIRRLSLLIDNVTTYLEYWIKLSIHACTETSIIYVNQWETESATHLLFEGEQLLENLTGHINAYRVWKQYNHTLAATYHCIHVDLC